MSTDQDDAAFSWSGDDDPTLSLSARGLDAADDAVLLPSGDLNQAQAAAEDEPAGITTFSLLAYGVLAGVYILFSFSWFSAGQSLITGAAALGVSPLLETVTFVLSFLVFLSPTLWFFAVCFNVKRNSLRLWLLVAGLLLFVPWPFFMGVVL